MSPLGKSTVQTAVTSNWKNLTPPNHDEIEKLRKLVSRNTGLQSDGSRESFLSASVMRRMAKLNLNNVTNYIARLRESGVGGTELQELSNMLLVHKTSFFRDRPHFELLEKRILPELARKGGPIRIWSAGCSTGQEVYSLALALTRCGISSEQAQILGTDLSTVALQEAQIAIFPDKKLIGLTEEERRFLEPAGDGLQRISKGLRRYVNFRRHNLVDVPYPRLNDENWSIIFCRNVLIYFSRSTIRAIAKRFHQNLHPGGSLFLGACESLFQLSEGFSLEQGGDAFIYRRNGSGNSTPKRAIPAPRPRIEVRPSVTVKTTSQPSLPKLAPDQTLDSEIDKAEAFRQAGEMDNANILLLEARERWPSEHTIGIALGRLALDRGALEEARSWLTMILEKDPLEPHALFLAGLTLFQLGLDLEAAEHFRRLLYLEKNFSLGFYYQGLIISRLGRKQLAQRAFRNALSVMDRGLAPTHPELAALPLNCDLIRSACRAKMTTERSAARR